MKIVLAVHGYPPELSGGTENSTQALARALAARGHTVTVIAGTMAWDGQLSRRLDWDADPRTSAKIAVHRIQRGDFFFDHWQKASHPGAGRLFMDILKEVQPDVLHVQHWIRLTSDLVWRAASLGIPSVVTLNDLWTNCLVAFRVRPDTREFCAVPMAPDPCLNCAAHVPPKLTWQSGDDKAAALRNYRDTARRELETARALLAPSLSHGQAASGWLGLDAAFCEERLRVIAPAHRLRQELSAARQVPKAFSAATPLVLAHFGHWSELKGTDLLLRALNLTREPERFHLKLAGGAPFPAFAARIKAMIEMARVKVDNLGPYQSAELATHPVSDAHLFVTPTRAHESFGLVIDEALELGHAVLVPNKGALEERAQQVDWATTFESASAEDLARTLDALADDPGRVQTMLDAAYRAISTNEPTASAWDLDRQVEATLVEYERAQALGAPDVAPLDPAAEAARLTAIQQWDHSLEHMSPDPSEKGPAPLRILLVIHDYLPRHIGGSELHTHQLAKALVERGHEVTVLFTECDLALAEGTRREGELDGVRTIEIIHNHGASNIEETWLQSRSQEIFRAEVQRLKPDVVHFHHTMFWGASCFAIAKAEGARVVLTLHDYHLVCHGGTLLDVDRLCDGVPGQCTACLPKDLNMGRFDDLKAVSLARHGLHKHKLEFVDAFISPSHFLYTRFEKAGMPIPRGKRHMILTGYPGERIQHKVRDPHGPLRVVYVGGVYHVKGVHVLLDAFRALGARDRSERHPIQLAIHGHLDWFPQYAEGLREMAVHQPVTFAGAFPPGEAWRVFESADVMVVPSIWYENRPITIPEAFINGVVPVVTDLGGMAESVRHGVDGLVFPRGDAAGLADMLERLADEPGLLERLQKQRPNLPDMPTVAEAIDEIYRKIEA